MMSCSTTVKTALVVVLALFGSSSVGAATFHVATYGENTATCGVPIKPCQTISFAIDLASENDTVLVHPGEYVEGILIATDGLQLISTKGRYATTIRNPVDLSPVGSATIRIDANRVRVGRRQQGFTIENRLGSGGRIRAASRDASRTLENVTIEGNYLGTDGRATFDVAGQISLQGRRHQIRYNRIVGNAESPSLGATSYDCSSCSGLVFSNNTVRYAGGGAIDLSLVPSASGGSNLIQKNVLVGERDKFRARLVSGSSFSDNVYVARRSDVFSDGFDLFAVGDVSVTGNIQAEALSFSVSDSAGTPFQPSGLRTYRDNLVVAADSNGFYLCLAPGAIFSNNTAVSSRRNAIQVESCTDTPPSAFLLSQNSTWDTQNQIGIRNFSDTRVEHQAHFFGGGDRAAADFQGTGIIRGTTTSRPNRTNVAAASKL